MTSSDQKWLQSALLGLHESLKNYLLKFRIHEFPTEFLFIFLQYYLKSLVTLDLKISKLEDKVITDIFLRFQTYPSFKLHLTFLATHLLFRMTDRSQFIKSFFPPGLAKIKKFLKDLILGLSDESHILKMKNEKKLHLYEDLKTKYLSMIDPNFQKDIFSACESNILFAVQNQTPIVSEREEYKMFKQVLTLSIVTFNDSNYLVKTVSDYYMRLLDAYSNYFSEVSPNPENAKSRSISTIRSSTSLQSNSLYNYPFHVLMSYFRLIYELKFIFGDINSKLHNFKFW
ncbi:hypothetical protein RF11_04233 [Thelohanellus kitauei]|uniref:Uncharacterized protein n=1 Tax=Thelohanellus kitauei TaxID=669202 RepID=A0A0C2MV93_THEKT|nr:hypothetical protein RF11_04233 [Thelohanellus kitauei]